MTEVGVKLTADTGQVSASMNELQANLKAAKKDLNEAKIGSEEYAEAQKRVKEATEQLTKAQGGSAESFSVLKEKIYSTVPGLQAAETGATSFGAALKALAANPIVLVLTAIVAALGFLYEAFTSTLAGANKVAQVFDGLKAALQEVYNRVMTFGGAIIKVFQGDFKGALNDAKASVNGLSTAIEGAYSKAAQITKRLQELKKEQREDDVDRARRERDLALLREKLNDDSVPLKERLAAAKTLRGEQVKNAEDDLKRTTEIANLKIQRLKMERDGEHKNADEIAELQKSIYETQKENALEGVRTNKVIRNLEKQGNAEAKTESAERQKAEKERLDNIRDYQNKIDKLREEEHLATIDDTYKKEKAQLEIKLQDDLRAAKLDLDQKKITKQQYADLEVEYKKLTALKIAEVDKKQALDEQKKSEENAKKIREFEYKLAADLEKIRLQQVASRSKDRQEQIKLIDSELLLQRTKHQLTFQMEKEAFDRKRDLERQNLVDAGASAAQLQAFDQETINGRMALDEKEKEVKLQNLSTVGNALQGLGQLVGQNTAAGKALSIAEATINTYTGATKALAQGGIFGAISAAGVIAAGLASVQKIVSTPVPGASGGGGGSAPSISIPSPLKPRAVEASSAVISPNSLSQLNATATRAYVVESDVSNNQQRIKRINRAARIG